MFRDQHYNQGITYQENSLGKIIKTHSAGKDRIHLSRNILQAIQQLARQNEVNDDTRDLVAFIALALDEISETIEASVAAWEKRGYWVKADRFRLDWEWAGTQAKIIRKAAIEEDWGVVLQNIPRIAEHLKDVKQLKRPSKTEPWRGAWGSLLRANTPKG